MFLVQLLEFGQLFLCHNEIVISQKTRLLLISKVNVFNEDKTMILSLVHKSDYLFNFVTCLLRNKL